MTSNIIPFPSQEKPTASKPTTDMNDTSSNLERYQRMTITDPDRFKSSVRRILANKSRYEQFCAPLNIPWWFVAVIHCRESDCNFDTHLHNGDSLKRRTINVPAGRPRIGQPPFTWEVSAVDALAYDELLGHTDWSLGAALDRLERYNGVGYKKRGLPSPYLFAGTSEQKAGKFVADGKFDSAVWDKQPGCAGILKLLEVN